MHASLKAAKRVKAAARVDVEGGFVITTAPFIFLAKFTAPIMKGVIDMKRKIIGITMFVLSAITMWFGFLCLFVSQLIK